MEETEGESRSGPGDMYGDGDCVVSMANFGTDLVPGAALVAGVGVMAGSGDTGNMRISAAPDVGGGAGGWSRLDGNVVLMKKEKVAPFSGTPFALMSPPCS